MVATNRLSNASEDILNMLCLWAYPGQVMALVDVDSVFTIGNVPLWFTLAVWANYPFNFDRWWIFHIINQERLVEQPIQVHTVSAAYDGGGIGQVLSRTALHGLFRGTSIEISPEAAQCTNLPSQVVASFIANSWTDPEEQIRELRL